MRRRGGLRMLLLASGLVGSAAAADGPGLALSGYVKSLLTSSRTVVGRPERYSLDLTRVRLEVQGALAEGLSLDLQYDNELLLGDYLRTEQFAAVKDMPVPTYWALQGNYVERARAYGQHRLYRASLNASLGDTDVRVGRQRIAWGTGRFWSPLDILNPVSPITLERAERPGVDAVLVERKVGALSRVAVVYAPQHDKADDSAAGLWHGNRAGIDYTVVAGRFARDRVVGIDLAGQLGGAGWRAEATHSDRKGGGRFARLLVGMDYAFANTLTLTGELYHDGAGSHDARRYDFGALLAGRVRNVGRRYAGLSAAYEITPLLTTRHDVVVNLDDRSRYYAPSLTWSLRQDIDATIGAQLYGGAPRTEFGFFHRVLHVQLQWFF